MAKRAATCSMEANAKRFEANEFVKSAEYSALGKHLDSQRKTLYDVEADLVEQIAAADGKL